MTRVLYFVAGAGIGSLVTWKLIEKKYKDLAQEEIASVKEALNNRKPVIVKEEKKAKDLAEKATHKKDISQYAKILDKEDYINPRTKRPPYHDPEADGPFTITPEEFGEIDEYETISLTYYADGTLADDMDEQVDDIDETIGKDSLDKFGEYEEDVVYVRNDKRKCDYEVLFDSRNYDDVIAYKKLMDADEEEGD